MRNLVSLGGVIEWYSVFKNQINDLDDPTWNHVSHKFWRAPLYVLIQPIHTTNTMLIVLSIYTARSHLYIVFLSWFYAAMPDIA